MNGQVEYVQLSITDITPEPEKKDTKFKTKQYNLSKENCKYYETFKDSFERLTSWYQYKVDCGAFLESLGNKDFATITASEIENYINSKQGSLQTKANCKAHIRSMMIYLVKNNVAGVTDKISKELLIYLISDR